MKNKIHITLFSLFLLLSFGSVEQVFACSCGFSSSCQKYNSADVVFVGKVIAIKKIVEDVYSVTFEISETFKGTNINEKINILSIQNDGGGCGYRFEQDKTYLVFAGNSKGLKDISGLWTSQCSGNQLIKYADISIDFLYKFKAFSSEQVIFGNLQDFSIGENRILPIEGIKIKAQSTKNKLRTFYGTTNKYGNFDINLPFGTYSVSPELPKDFIFGET